MQTRPASTIKGIDVSHHNSDGAAIDWNKVKADGVQFVFVKASEGVTYKDPKFAVNLNGARAVGIKAGAYHFARPENGQALSEAKTFVSQLATVQYDLMPVLDLESPIDPSKCTKANMIAFVKTFVDYVQAQTGRKVMLYTGNWFSDMYGGFDNAFKDMPLWIANYAASISAPPNTGGWTAWTVWQYGEKGTINGISGNVDMNVAVSLDALMADVKPKTPQFSVYQYGNKLSDFYTQAEAAAEAVKWSHSYVKRISDGDIVSHNWSDVKQLEKFLAAPSYIQPTLAKLIGAGKLDDPTGDETFYRILAILDRYKLFG
ncbi:glycoside hydrolase family 25 protein [Paenibacillus hexagrammi]|uniref:Glycoside hydrolase family 25 protein n=1 Tax=Paenibacillus hexagrammi TaxID=2908839 RepID=A0ABY3SRG0_9BACL|nr:glycoside hydrolase family 25 protein [Paenibacillus sp. YPD9-1]UJF36618.1 glycoside hydrolase family 25 protein [Paenibacillus sp. YPD9-1]